MHLHLFAAPAAASDAVSVDGGAGVRCRRVSDAARRSSRPCRIRRQARPALGVPAAIVRSSSKSRKPLGGLGNSAFNDYRRATLRKLEDEAAEFRTFLDGLKRAADAAEFDAFLKSRRDERPAGIVTAAAKHHCAVGISGIRQNS